MQNQDTTTATLLHFPSRQQVEPAVTLTDRVILPCGGCQVSRDRSIKVAGCQLGRELTQARRDTPRQTSAWHTANYQFLEHFDPRTYISTTETAKMIRAALKASFPTTRFSVKSRSYAGGSAVDIYWTDGPSSPSVEKITKRFAGASFDAMIDLKSYHDSRLEDGTRVHFGADYVTCHREFSAAFAQEVADRVADDWGAPRITVKNNSRGADFSDAWKIQTPNMGGHLNLQDLIWRAISAEDH